MIEERNCIADYIEERARKCAAHTDPSYKEELSGDAVMLRALAAEIRAGLHMPD